MHTTTQAVPNHNSAQTAIAPLSWGAIIAGATAAIIVSAVLLLLGAGVGLSITSWDDSETGTGAVNVVPVAWLILTQMFAAATGGYLAGRLGVHATVLRSREANLRDAAHGFLTWTIATLAVAVISVMLIGKTLSLAVSSGAAVASTAVGLIGTAGGIAAYSYSSGQESDAENSEHNGGEKIDALLNYLVDKLFRSERDAADHVDASAIRTRIEAGRIFLNNVNSDSLPERDQQYLAKIVAKLADLSLDEANQRVGETFDAIHTAVSDAQHRLHETAERARKIAAHASLWTFVALMAGAIVASFCAAAGGKQRDRLSTKPDPLL